MKNQPLVLLKMERINYNSNFVVTSNLLVLVNHTIHKIYCSFHPFPIALCRGSTHFWCSSKHWCHMSLLMFHSGTALIWFSACYKLFKVLGVGFDISNQNLSLPSMSNILWYIPACRASAIYGIPIYWRYTCTRVPALLQTHSLPRNRLVGCWPVIGLLDLFV